MHIISNLLDYFRDTSASQEKHLPEASLDVLPEEICLKIINYCDPVTDRQAILLLNKKFSRIGLKDLVPPSNSL